MCEEHVQGPAGKGPLEPQPHAIRESGELHRDPDGGEVPRPVAVQGEVQGPGETQEDGVSGVGGERDANVDTDTAVMKMKRGSSFKLRGVEGWLRGRGNLPTLISKLGRRLGCIRRGPRGEKITSWQEKSRGSSSSSDDDFDVDNEDERDQVVDGKMEDGAVIQPAGVRLATQIFSSVQPKDPVTPCDDDEPAETSADDVDGIGVRDAPGGEGNGAGPCYVAVQIHREGKREDELDVTHAEGDQEDD